MNGYAQQATLSVCPKVHTRTPTRTFMGQYRALYYYCPVQLWLSHGEEVALVQVEDRGIPISGQEADKLPRQENGCEIDETCQVFGGHV